MDDMITDSYRKQLRNIIRVDTKKNRKIFMRNLTWSKLLMMLELLCWQYFYLIDCQNEISSRIVGGSTTDIKSAKFMVSLRLNGRFICGGSLLNTEFIVTAAHCVKGVLPKQLTVTAAATRLSDTGIRRGVNKIIIPKDYNHRTFHKDIAILKLSGKIVGDSTDTVELCKSNWKAGDLVQIYGWGQINEKINLNSNTLRTITVPLIARNKCINMYKRNAILTDTMFCAGNLLDKDSCSGDSGGPVIYKGQLCGIVSWGLGCARSNFPGVYTNIRSVRSFIDKALKL